MEARKETIKEQVENIFKEEQVGVSDLPESYDKLTPTLKEHLEKTSKGRNILANLQREPKK
ncbi:MAG: hypothetical protein WC662_02070 [Candidatus Paceibacterota bacterium]|jgi:hypothetical protein